MTAWRHRAVSSLWVPVRPQLHTHTFFWDGAISGHHSQETFQPNQQAARWLHWWVEGACEFLRLRFGSLPHLPRFCQETYDLFRRWRNIFTSWQVVPVEVTHIFINLSLFSSDIIFGFRLGSCQSFCCLTKNLLLWDIFSSYRCLQTRIKPVLKTVLFKEILIFKYLSVRLISRACESIPQWFQQSQLRLSGLNYDFFWDFYIYFMQSGCGGIIVINANPTCFSYLFHEKKRLWYFS